jgi:hypothetical protein
MDVNGGFDIRRETYGILNVNCVARSYDLPQVETVECQIQEPLKDNMRVCTGTVFLHLPDMSIVSHLNNNPRPLVCEDQPYPDNSGQVIE